LNSQTVVASSISSGARATLEGDPGYIGNAFIVFLDLLIRKSMLFLGVQHVLEKCDKY